MNFRNSEHSYLPWGHFRCHTKFGPDRFSRLNVYWIQRNRQTATDKLSIYNFSLRRVISKNEFQVFTKVPKVRSNSSSYIVECYTNIQLFHITIRN